MTNSQWYLITWGLVGAVWGAGAVYNALYGPKVVERRRAAQGLDRLVWLGLFLLATRVLPPNFWTPITIPSPWLRTAGIVILVLSTLFILWARWVLGTLWSGAAMVKQDHQLRTSGPYRITRNPIYTGFLGMAVGTMLMNGFGIMLLVVPALLLFFEFKIYTEEGLLTKTFGEQYLEYKRRVPQLVPGLVLPRRK
ncbi:MAG: isoprenylcysteine carboxylmethyltransferase family protein [Chloroflexi bacterium]|nr:isoprenylcysteine carboxylmethyltransferase family protein [Chloroflexota bacterium]